MPVNWDQCERDIDRIIKESAGKTDERLASRISSITRMTDEEIRELFPEPADIKKLAALMKIVQSAEDQNTRTQHFLAQAETFAGIVLKLLARFA